MSSCWGHNVRISVFGQSHSEAIGVVVDGLPAGFRPDMDELGAFMARRAPGGSLATPRKEADQPRFLSGIAAGVLTGAPLCAIINNTNVRPGDYTEFKDKPRPGHADYTAEIKYHGFQDASGGGHFSGRLTAPLCVAGGICLQLLRREGIRIGAHIERIADIRDRRFDPAEVSERDIDSLCRGELTVIDSIAAEKMADCILQARQEGDSVGGVIECAVTGLPAGMGDPMFDGMENAIASAIFAIPAIKGIEFGSGFDCASMRGSQHNDPFTICGDRIVTRGNNHGGILGGITSGMPLVFRAAVKPTPSIAAKQNTVSLSEKKDAKLEIKGRHDPCIVPRAVPCVEAVTALVIYDKLLDKKKDI
ncbi:MAG: chorismate synthase [Oscillospiraceae bacterium]|nr:chorismate synthase [Oscillospiraceae bacterium]